MPCAEKLWIWLPLVLSYLLSIRAFRFSCLWTKVEEQVGIETEVRYGRTISRTANLYSKRRQSKNKGKEAQHNNIRAARVVATAVRTILGPQCMDKMLVEVAKTQDDEATIQYISCVTNKVPLK